MTPGTTALLLSLPGRPRVRVVRVLARVVEVDALGVRLRVPLSALAACRSVVDASGVVKGWAEP